MSTIVFEQVTKRYADGHEAVRALDLEVGDGEFVILVGPSGCGKSTALRMIAGLEDISDGRLWIGGDVINDRAPKDRDIAMVFQNYALYPHMSVRDNMGFALRLQGLKRGEVDRRVGHAAGVLGLTEHLDRKPANLSGGQRQRVAMGRAIVREPKAFLMDEPLSNLDAKLRVEMRAAVSRLQQRLGTTTVYVTHDQTEAMTLGDRVAVMRDGVLQQVGTPRDLYEHPRNLFVASFIGSPAMNLFTAQVEDGAIHTSMGAIPLDDHLRARLDAGGAVGRHVVLGVRPEAFEDARHAPSEGGWTFEATVELTESLGSEIYVHFAAETTGGPSGEAAEELRALSEVGGGETADAARRAVARVDAASALTRGDRGRLWLDTRRLYLFDADGRALGHDAATPGLAMRS
ncbi:Trehalose import ATP-binding protein SugC [Baekduia alba]|uniref:ABC transporter ATP-binding protein n=1 Tax=Baekduia alba TaxID=2997333 RepID=UPI00233FFE2A|nr:sn-glycerol-3-phosphate ABC transporter ATP-binding protein UgpC [Baekduia alba]WCB93458.1 Trehalose import ATP-binding protein SugC [Baekduia alba]